MTLSLGTPEKAGEDAARFVGEGFRKLKVKVGIDVALRTLIDLWERWSDGRIRVESA